MAFAIAAIWIGAVAGLRTMTAPAAVSWAAYLGAIDLSNSPLFFLGHIVSPIVFTALALAELVADKLPATPSRKTPLQFGSRLASGALCGAALGADVVTGALFGVVGAAGGTFAGAALRSRLAAAFGRDAPAAIIEDFIAIAAAALIVTSAAR